MNYKKILERLNFWHSIDKKNQKAFDNFIKVFAPDSYEPILENTCVDSYLDAFDKQIREELSYYIYDAKNMKGKAIITTKEGKKYDAKKDKEFIKYLENEM